MTALLRVASTLYRKREQTSQDISARTALLILGGGVRAFYCAGALAEFHELGLSKVFDVVVGVSVGAVAGAYFLAGKNQTDAVIDLTYELLAEPGFISYRRMRKGIIDTELLMQRIRSGPRSLDIESVRKTASEFYIGYTSQRGGHCFLNAKEARPDLISVLRAAVGFPGLSPWKNEVNGEVLMDRVFDRDIVGSVLETFKPTDLLIIPNCPLEQARAPQRSISAFVLTLAFLLNARNLSVLPTTAAQRFRSLARYTSSTRANVAVLWPPKLSLEQFTRDEQSLRNAFVQTRQLTREAFAPLA